MYWIERIDGVDVLSADELRLAASTIGDKPEKWSVYLVRADEAIALAPEEREPFRLVAPRDPELRPGDCIEPTGTSGKCYSVEIGRGGRGITVEIDVATGIEKLT